MKSASASASAATAPATWRPLSIAPPPGRDARDGVTNDVDATRRAIIFFGTIELDANDPSRDAHSSPSQGDMRTRSKKRPRVDRADPPAPETPGAGVVDAVDAPVPVPVPADALRLVLERFDRLEDELRKSRAEHLETRRTLAELVRSIRPTFDVN